MKIPAFILVISTFLCFSSYAQVSFVPKAGVTFTSVDFDEKPKGQQYKMGLVVGAGFNLPVIEDFLSIQPELLFIQKGYISDFSYRTIEPNDPILGANDYQSTITLNYLELPLLAKFSFGNDVIKAYVNAGPSIGFCVNGKIKIEGEEVISKSNLKFGDKFTFDKEFGVDNRFDVGAQFGGGISFQAGPGALLLDVRYGLGFSNLYKTGDNVSKEEATSKHRIFAITVGYAIPFGKK